MPLPSVDTEVLRIADYCMDGKTLTHKDAIYLCDIEPFTPEGRVLSYVARKRHFEAAGGIAEVHGQIGMDANPCPANCEFCSFASNGDARPNGRHEMSLDAILRYAHDYHDNGANVLTLMITNSYNFEQYLRYIDAVHKELPDFPIMANMGDFDYSMACELKAVGVGSVYHAIRMGEGEINNLSVEARVKTIEAAHEAGLKFPRALSSSGQGLRLRISLLHSSERYPSSRSLVLLADLSPCLGRKCSMRRAIAGRR